MDRKLVRKMLFLAPSTQLSQTNYQRLSFTIMLAEGFSFAGTVVRGGFV